MTHTLRPYQVAAIESLRDAIRTGKRAVLLVLPTGGGKTAIASEITRQHIARGGKVLFLAHRQELIRQAARRLRADGVDSLGILQGADRSGMNNPSVTVASIPTLASHAERGLPLPTATLVIFDEAHHTKAKSWEQIAAVYAGSILIGLTATPERADGAPLGDIFDALVVVSTVRELTEKGYLVPCAVFGPSDYKDALAADPADAYLEHGGGRRGLIFCPTIQHARDVADRLTAAGVPSACVDGAIPTSVRIAALQRFATGELQVVTNCGVLSEGFDDPSAEVCILARACNHPGLYLQIVGRVLRPADGKESCKLIDLRGVVHRHGLPDDEREYSLTGRAIQQSEKLPPLRQCRKCGAVFRPVPRCPACGAASAMPEPPEVRRERLQQIFQAQGTDKRKAFWDGLCATAKERGYKAGWAYFRYVARFGEVPRFDPAPPEPTTIDPAEVA